MNVLIADAMPVEVRESLQAMGLAVTEAPELNADTLPGALCGVNVLVVGDTRVSRRAIEAAPVLSLVVRAGHGVDTIDVPAASERGVFVAHCPGFDAAARAELALGMMIALDRDLVGAHAAVRDGKAGDAPTALGAGLRGRSLGLVGFGAGAAELMEAARALGMRVAVASDRLTTSLAAEAGVYHAADLPDLFRHSDIVSLHPDEPASGVVVTAELLALLDADAIVINTAAPGLVDHDAVRARLEAGALRVGFDVFAEAGGGEGTLRLPLEGGSGVIATPHLASRTRQAATAAAAQVVRVVQEFLLEDRLTSAVNLETEPDAPAMLIVHHANEVGSLAALLERLREGRINVLDISNVVFSGGRAACTRLRLSAVADPALLDALRRLATVRQVEQVSLG